ncbi:MAG: chemotaxis protein CheD [Planctomycetota bacterium]
MNALPSTQTLPTAEASRSAGGIVHSVGIAGLKVVRAPDRIRTVLGSCVGIAVYDRVAKLGALGHVILPDSKEGSGDPGKFADTAVDMLMEMLVEEGADRKRIKAKIAGGAAMFATATQNGLGDRNVAAVRARLEHHSIRLIASAVGGTRGRKMMLDPGSGDVLVEIIGEAPECI